MASQQNTPRPRSPKRRLKRPSPEEVWVREFVEFTGTDGVTSFNTADLNGVSLTRAIEALRSGNLAWANKSDGSGSLCCFEHSADPQDAVEVTVWFEANEQKLEIREARRIIMENDSEPNAA
jgi:hypothetical protein